MPAALMPALMLGWTAELLLPVTTGTCGIFICRMLLPAIPSQRRFDTSLPASRGAPHVSSWLSPLAAAATGSITRPAEASAEVRNIKDLTDILAFLRRPGREWSAATLHDPCQLAGASLQMSRIGTISGLARCKVGIDDHPIRNPQCFISGWRHRPRRFLPYKAPGQIPPARFLWHGFRCVVRQSSAGRS